jgi:hypothetical protein
MIVAPFRLLGDLNAAEVSTGNKGTRMTVGARIGLAILGFVISIACGPAIAQESGGCSQTSSIEIDVSVDPSADPKSGKPFRLMWDARHLRCKDPHYLVIALPERVRFSGSGAVALGPGERAPHDIGYREDRMRLAIPLRSGASLEGEITIVPFLTGSMKIEWAIAIPQGEITRIVEGEGISFDVRPGPPKIVIQDVYAADRPLDTLTSESGDYRLDIFDGYFRVTDTLTGALVVAAEGYRPGFSPTSRFLHVFGDKASQLRVFDLYSETLALDLDPEGAGGRGFFVQGLEWSAGDTFLMVAYEAAGAVGFKEMLFDRAFRYQAEGCGACSPDETIVAIDIENAVVAIGRPGDGPGRGDLYSLLADRQIVDRESEQTVPLLVSLDPTVSTPTQRPARYVRKPSGPDWFLNGSRKSSIDYRQGVPIILAGEAVTAQAEEKVAIEDEASWRSIVALKRTGLLNRETRLTKRLSSLGIDLSPTPELAFDRLTFLHVGEDYDSYSEEDYERLGELYRIEPGRAALARGLASRDLAKAIDEKVFGLTEDHNTCGLASVNRAFKGQAQLWTWKDGSRLYQVIQYYCYVSTGGIPAGIAFLVTADENKIDYSVLGETVDGEMELYGSYVREPWSPEDKGPSLANIQMYGALRVFRPDGSRLALVNAQGSLAVYDVARGRTVLSIDELQEFARVANVAATIDGKHIVQINDDGRFFIYELRTGTQVLSGRYLDDEVVVYDKALRFDATAEGANHVHLKFPGDRSLYQLSQFDAVLRTANIAARWLGGASEPQQSTVITSPPAVTVSLVSKAHVSATVQIHASAARELKDIRVYRDGRLIDTLPLGAHETALETSLKISPETRTLAVRATDKFGATSAAAVLSLDSGASGKDKAVGRLFVVAVGTDTYDDPRIADLRYAASDARAFAKAVLGAGSPYYNQVHTTVLENRPNLSVVLPEQIKSIAARMTDADTLLVHIAGHGLLGEDGGFYLADRTTRIDDLLATAMAWTDLSEALSSAAGRVFIFLDACHSGAAGSATNDQAVDSLLASAKAPINVIAASKGRQFSFEGGQFAGGAFTSALNEILLDVSSHDSNGNGVLEFSELYRSLKQRVVTDTRGEQIPWISRSDLVGDAPVL